MQSPLSCREAGADIPEPSAHVRVICDLVGGLGFAVDNDLGGDTLNFR